MGRAREYTPEALENLRRAGKKNIAAAHEAMREKYADTRRSPRAQVKNSTMDEIERIAEERGTTKADIIREALDWYVKDRPEQPKGKGW